ILRDGEKVLIRNELRKGKMDDAYNEHGIVVRRIHGNVYEISKRRKKGVSEITEKVIKHISQLKRVEEGEVGINR
ncbi:MAG: hypothetical protein ACRDDF_12855, partial [Aeromonas sp.]